MTDPGAGDAGPDDPVGCPGGARRGTALLLIDVINDLAFPGSGR